MYFIHFVQINDEKFNLFDIEIVFYFIACLKIFDVIFKNQNAFFEKNKKIVFTINWKNYDSKYLNQIKNKKSINFWIFHFKYHVDLFDVRLTKIFFSYIVTIFRYLLQYINIFHRNLSIRRCFYSKKKINFANKIFDIQIFYVEINDENENLFLFLWYFYFQML